MIILQDVEDYLTTKQIQSFNEFNPKEMETLSNWDNVPNIHIALYLILENPKPKQKVKKTTKKRSILKLKNEMIIRKVKKDLKLNEFTWYAGDEDYIYNDEIINSVLGKYGKYFTSKHKLPLQKDDEWKTKVREYKKENIVLDKPRCLVTESDELSILRNFFTEAESYKESILSKYLEYKTINHNNKGKKLPTEIDNDIKKILAKRLTEIGTTNKKIDSLCSRAITAIKNELLNLK